MKKLLLLALSGMAVCGALAQGDPDTVTKIIEEGKARNQTRFHLEYLCGQIGPRLTGSLALQRACDWTKDSMAGWGLSNAHLEQWGEIPFGFDRAPSGQVGRMTSPSERTFEFTTSSWTYGTRGLWKGAAMMEPASMAEFESNKSKFRGAWMVMLPRTGEGLPTKEVRDAVMAAAEKAGIRGTVSGSRGELVLTGGNWPTDIKKVSKLVKVTVRKSDYDAVVEALKAKKKTELEFDIKQSFRNGPVPVYNVVAEIPGTEKPDEVVIVSGHLDSWDGPGSQGALDNGTGTMVTLEAARILMAVGAKPKRTIRFIMWSGEEQGLFGSRKYVEQHAAELPKISAVLVDDGGTDYWGGFVGLETQSSFFKPSMDALNAAFPDLPMKFRVQARMPRGGGSDHASFNAKGVPGFFTDEVGVSDYNYIHHTQHDRLEAAINAYLIQSSTAAAVTAYNLAGADQLLPREPAPGG